MHSFLFSVPILHSASLYQAQWQGAGLASRRIQVSIPLSSPLSSTAVDYGHLLPTCITQYTGSRRCLSECRLILVLSVQRLAQPPLSLACPAPPNTRDFGRLRYLSPHRYALSNASTSQPGLLQAITTGQEASGPPKEGKHLHSCHPSSSSSP